MTIDNLLLICTTQWTKLWVPRMVRQNPESGSIYTGYGGTAYILYLLGCHPLNGEEDGTHHFEQALQVLERAAQLVSRKRVTFLEGSSGLKALTIAIYSKLRRSTEALLAELLQPPNFSSAEECEVSTHGVKPLNIHIPKISITLKRVRNSRFVIILPRWHNKARNEMDPWEERDTEMKRTQGLRVITLVIYSSEKNFNE